MVRFLNVAVVSDTSQQSAKLKRPKPRTPGQRARVYLDRSELWKGRPIKELTVAMRSTGGRGIGGRIAHHHRGGGHRKRYRLVDFARSKPDIKATVLRLEYDPNRNAHIALVRYDDDDLSYIIAPDGIAPGMTILSTRANEIPIKLGNCMPIGNMPVGTVIHNVEMSPGKGGQIARSAGTYAELLDKRSKPGYALVRMRSMETRYFLLTCAATIGSVSNPLANREKLGKAGRNRWKGRRPHVRGVAMNPVDHPMGGGEGRSSGGRPSCGPTGILAKGFKTRRRAPHKNVVMTRWQAKMKKKRG